jgi:hypothetical protein
MSASVPAPDPQSPPRGSFTPARMLGVIAFAAVGFVAVWQGFGAAGFGTDVHAKRVVVAVLPLLALGLTLVRRKELSAVRAVAVLLGVGGAGALWWYVPSSDYKSAISLRDAADDRAKVREYLANPLLDNPKNGPPARAILDSLNKQYPSLVERQTAEYDRWVEEAGVSLAEQFRKTPYGDIKGGIALYTRAKALAELKHPAATQAEHAAAQWAITTLQVTTRQLEKVLPGDWAEFNDTAPGRKSLAEAFPHTRNALLLAEAGWVDSSAEFIVSNNLTPKPGAKPQPSGFWLDTHKDVMALQSLDTSDGRFVQARQRLFKVAHEAAQREVNAHMDANRYGIASAIATRHALDWNSTAVLLGKTETEAIDSLRDVAKFFYGLSERFKVAEPIDIAPPPRIPGGAEPIEIAPPPRTKP